MKRKNGGKNGPCGVCQGCQTFCGVCVHCRLMPEFGGNNPNRVACQKRKYRCEKIKKEKKIKIVSYNCAVCGKNYEDLFSGQDQETCEKIKHRALNHIRRCKYSLLEASLSCTICENKFKARSLLNTHIRRYHKKPYSCEQCDFSTGTNYDLEKHKNYKHNGKLFTCEICGQNLAYATGLRNHMKRVHSGTSFKCDQCDHCSNTEDNLQRHKDNMHSGVLLQCDKCPSQYHSPSSLGTHINMVHKEVEYALCDQCPYQTKSKSSLKKHRESVHDKKLLSCKSCNFTSTQNSTILTHTKTVHQNIFFSCDQCEAKFPKRNALGHHKESKHGGGKKLNCEEYNYTTRHKKFLKDHVMVKHKEHKEETSEKETKKEDMTEEDATSQHVTMVRKSVDGQVSQQGEEKEEKEEERREKCKLCGETFLSKKELLTHLKNHKRKKLNVEQR